MKFVNLILILSVTLPYVKCELETSFSKPRFTEPEDVGMGHTKVIQDLHQRMRDKPPLNGDEYMIHMIEAVVEYMCKPMTRECVEDILSTTDAIDMSYQNGYAHLTNNILSDDFDEEVLSSIENLFFSVGLLEWDESPEEILNVMYKNFENLRDNTEVENEHHRLVGLVAYSVGMESAKQWHEIFNDDENQFHKLIHAHHENSRRNLQAQALGDLLSAASENANIESQRLIEADIIGGASGAIVVGFDRFVRNKESEKEIASEALEKAVSTAVIFSSTNVAVQTGILGGDGNGAGILGGLGGIFGGDGNGTGILGGLGGLFGGGNNTGTSNNGTGIFGGLFGGGDNNGTGILGNVLGGGNNNGTGFLGNVLGGGNNDNNGTGFLGNVLGGGNNDNNGTGFLGNVLGGGNNDNNNNNNTDGEGGGGLFSGISNLFGGGNNNDVANEEGTPQQLDSVETGGLVNDIAGNVPNNNNDNDTGVGSNLATNNGGGIANQASGTTSNSNDTTSAVQTTTEESSGGVGTGAVGNILGGIGGFLGAGNNGNDQNTEAAGTATEEGTGNAVAQGLEGLSGLATGFFGGGNNAANRQPNGN